MIDTTQSPADTPRAPAAPAAPTRPRTSRRLRWWSLLFLVQFIAVLWPPFYNRAEPYWLGIPFFYWYQLLWVVIGGVCTAVVYFATQRSP